MDPKFEKIHSLEQRALNAYAYELDEFDAPWHYHPEYELTYITSSNGVRYVGNSVENFRSGDLVLIGPNLPHCWKNTGPQLTVAGAVVIQWNEQLLPKDWLKQIELDNVRGMFDKAARGIHFSNTGHITTLVASMPSLSPSRKFLTFLEVLHLLSGINHRCLSDAGFETGKNSLDHERINRAYKFVRTGYANKITLTTISDEMSMTEESFSRFFSRVMQKPFFTFLNEYRINAACRMLIETDHDVAQVAYTNGFDSLPFFYRQFKRYKALSPKAYRAMYRKIDAG